jgi:hypothetical protein
VSEPLIASQKGLDALLAIPHGFTSSGSWTNAGVAFQKSLAGLVLGNFRAELQFDHVAPATPNTQRLQAYMRSV